MLTIDDIRLLVAAGEGYNAEFKVSVPSKVKELTEEVCAFANAAGGVVLIGINDTNQFIGVTIDNAKRSAIQNSLGEITPHLSCSLSFVEVEGKTIGVIEVPSGPNKPYVLSGAIYVRIGPNTQKLTTAEQMRDFFQQSNRIYFDEVPCPGFNATAMVDQDFLAIFKQEASISLAVPDEQLFRNFKLYDIGNKFKNGAALFFGKQPESLVENAVIRCIAFQDTDKRFIIDDQLYRGNLYNQFIKSMQWLRGKLNIRYDIEGQGSGPRKEIWEIPETVFKESLINALAHRDYYDKGSVIHIEVFTDRVEISNPGGLVSAIPESEFGKRSHSRNPLIFGLFARMHLVEQVGSGVGRIRDLMKGTGLPEPVFQKEGIFAVILMRPVIASGESREKTRMKTREKTAQKTVQKTTQKTTQKTAQKILQLIIESNAITTIEMAEKLEITRSAVSQQIAKLKKQRIIKRVGSDKSGIWVIITGSDNE